MNKPSEFGRRLATVHLGFAILCTLLTLPYLFAGIESWWHARQFGAFAPFSETLYATARNALVKAGMAALGAGYFFWRWRTLMRGQK
ncbi:MAG: hypothetical protein IT493_00255 [Gammaproteobacteria bacterium]|nr:hypothetical protein [Gammaproteobacteria bacterium]